MSMGMSLGQYVVQEQTQRLLLVLPPTNWSLLDAFREEGDTPLRFNKIQLDLSGLTLEERLKVVDSHNEVFRYEYVQAESEDGEKKGRCYKIPLMRDINVKIDEIKVPISKTEYDIARTILKGAGIFQRIARAVPYLQLNKDVTQFVQSRGFTIDDTVIIGVDRGGRLPSFILREALGKTDGYTIKIDQASGDNRELDIERLNDFIGNGVLQNKFVLFVDSTVDSGRQINVLRKYFDQEKWKVRIGHNGWAVVGSNEHNENLYNHLNINWGLDPDSSFEDDPNLMGVDYLPGYTTKVVDCPSESSKKIKDAILEVPRGVVLDLSNLGDLLRIKKSYSQIDRALKSKTWKRCKDTRTDLGVSGIEFAVSIESDEKLIEQRKKLLVIGDSKQVTLCESEVEYLIKNLVNFYDVFAGTDTGNPGKVLDRFNAKRNLSAQLYQPTFSMERYNDGQIFGNQINFHGDTKDDFRENLIQSADAVLALGGNVGTLKEIFLSVFSSKPTYVLSNYGYTGNFVEKSRVLKRNTNLHLVETLPEVIQKLREISK